MPSSGHDDHCDLELTASMLPALDLHKTCLVNHQLRMWEKLMGPYPYLLKYWLLIDSGREGVIIVS